MAPAGKQKDRRKGPAGSAKDNGGAHGEAAKGGMGLQYKVAAGVAVVAAASAAKLAASGGSTESIAVNLIDAGAPALSALGNRTLSNSEFASLAKSSSFYSAQDGRRLRHWGDVARAAAEGERLSLLQGPPQDQPFNRHFVWPGVQVGHRVTVAEVPNFDKKRPIELETLSMSPRVLYVKNFMSSDEADALVRRATDKSNPYSIRPSTVGHQSWTQGSGASSTSSTRTSENGFDIDSPTARRLKDRAWKLLRLSGPYDESMVDGFQVLRYKQRQAYIAHQDSFPVGASPDHNWDPSDGGTNRFATLFVYLSDVEEGGQTVFPKAAAIGESRDVPEEAKKLFPKKGWETEMLEDCYSRLNVPPKKGNAILFYSQQGGQLDPMALHGGCPVLNGTKWAANLWFWNQCRFGQCYEWHKKAGVRMDAKFFQQPPRR